MSVLQRLLQRWGVVKLRRYGLELTPDDRIVSNRPAVLDDGMGGRIVGWRDSDSAISMLSVWSSSAAVARRVAVPAELAGTQTAATSRDPASAPANAMQNVMQEQEVDVAAEPAVDEDDWEWTIALARARAAEAEAETARPSAPSLTSRVEPSVPPAPERLTRLAALVSAKVPPASGESPKAEPVGITAYNDHSRVPARLAPAIPRSASAPMAIPVPAPRTMATKGRSRLEPVVHPTQVPSASASRLAKGTGPVDPPATRRGAIVETAIVETTIPDLPVGDRARPGAAAPSAAAPPAAALRPSRGDRTEPGGTLPPVRRAVELPSIKRRMPPR